jgi:endo-1,4-beta-xylanase
MIAMKTPPLSLGRPIVAVSFALFLCSVMAPNAFAQAAAAAPAASAATAPAPGVANSAATPALPLEPQALVPGAKVVTLWPPGSPFLGQPTMAGFNQPESFTGQPPRVSAVKNVQNPSIELHLAPADKNTGTSIIVASGGANTSENVGPEGTQIATWLNSIGINAFIIRYRLQPYSSVTDALYDSLQAIRVVRANAKEWGVNPNKIGYMGFSAGGEQAARVALFYDHGNPDATDPVAKVSSRPDFVVLVYAGWLVGGLDMGKIPDDVPPAFMAVSAQDKYHADQTMEFYMAIYNKMYAVNKNATFLPELHVYAEGAHGGGISPRNGTALGQWQMRFVDWLKDLDQHNAAAANPRPAAGSGRRGRAATATAPVAPNAATAVSTPAMPASAPVPVGQ